MKFVHGDINKSDVKEKVSEMMGLEKADLVLSDAVPDFIGERFADHMRSVELNIAVIDFCDSILMDGGMMLMKIIQGPSEPDLFVKLVLI